MGYHTVEVSSKNELEYAISRLKHKLKKGERVKLILNNIDLINYVTKLSMKYGLSLINAEETYENRIIVEFENRFK